MNAPPTFADGAAVMARLDELAALSDEEGRVTRLFLSPAHKRAAQRVRDWMRAAGMSADIDAIGNVAGRYEAAASGAPALLLGSHIDTVRDAGRYDGNFGVVAAISAVEGLHRRGRRLDFAVEIVAFGDEEGVRFPTTLSGSRAVAGRFDPKSLAVADADGVTLEAALRGFGCDVPAIADVARDPAKTLAYLELHIEQGPVLEAKDAPLGIVTAINGASRFAIEVGGMAGHAGTVPMAIRKDALAGAAEMILAIEARAAAEPDLVATVGVIDAKPGAINVIPGACRFTLDIRAPRDAMRRAAAADLDQALRAIARRRGLTLDIRPGHDAAATPCDPRVQAALGATLTRLGLPTVSLPSGAGHDAMAIAPLCPIGMLFARCKGGISHNPAESITVADADVSLRALIDFLDHFDAAAFAPR